VNIGDPTWGVRATRPRCARADCRERRAPTRHRCSGFAVRKRRYCFVFGDFTAAGSRNSPRDFIRLRQRQTVSQMLERRRFSQLSWMRSRLHARTAVPLHRDPTPWRAKLMWNSAAQIIKVNSAVGRELQRAYGQNRKKKEEHKKL